MVAVSSGDRQQNDSFFKKSFQGDSSHDEANHHLLNMPTGPPQNPGPLRGSVTEALDHILSGGDFDEMPKKTEPQTMMPRDPAPEVRGAAQQQITQPVKAESETIEAANAKKEELTEAAEGAAKKQTVTIMPAVPEEDPEPGMTIKSAR